MGTRKPKKPEKKGFLAGLLAGFGGGKKKAAGKKKPAGKGGKGAPARKGAVPAKKPKPVPPPPPDDFDIDLGDSLQPSAPMAGGFGDMDDELFAGLEFGNNPPDMSGMLPPQPPVAPPAYQAEQRIPPAAPAHQPSAPAPAPSSAEMDNSKLFPEGVDSSLDALFDSFELGGAPATPPPSMPAAPAAAAPAPAQPAPPPAPPAGPPPGAPTQPFQGQAPAAAARPQPPAPAQPPAGDGLVSIGKLLVDQNTLKRIIDNAEKRGAGLYTTTKVISESRGQDLDAILHAIDRCQGVAGSMIVGRDGLVISSTLPAEYEKEMIGAIASSMQTNLDVQCKKMKLGPARQIIVDTEGGVLLLMALEVGVLVVLSQSLMQLDLAGVLQAIASVSEKA
jgi:predicted regulator of Ras-like GTPase activity (Roadblock/LC7/MglB family)